MNKVRVKIKPGSVQETMMPQLYAKCYAMRRWPGYFSDNECLDIKRKLDYDFLPAASRLGRAAVETGALSAACRQRAFAAEIRDYISFHPTAQVVLLGCGLDTVGHQADNGRCSFVNIDHSDVIDLREKVVPKRNQEKNISADIKDISWFDELAYDPADGAVFAASGLFLYWKRNDVRELLYAMNTKFAGARLVFDAQNRIGAVNAKRALQNAGIYAAVKFYLDDPEKELAAWNIGCSLITCKRMVSDYGGLDGRFSLSKRLASAYSDKSRMSQINVIHF